MATAVTEAASIDRSDLEFAACCAAELERRLRWRANPDQYFRERLGVELWSKQVEIVRSVRDHGKTHVRSGHKVGKTLVAAGIVLWFLDCFRPSKVITTSATYSDVQQKLWGAVRSLYRKNGSWLGKINEMQLRISDDHYAVGLSPNDVESFQGHNAPRVLAVFDEASSTEQKFFDASDAMATSMLAIGNPLLTSGPFYKYARSSEWNHIHISCLDHPNVVERRTVIPGGPSYEWVESRKQYWGETSPLYLSRVAGEFPEESSDTLFPLALIRACFDRWEKARDLKAEPEPSKFGLDVARAGGDRTIGYFSDWCRMNGLDQAMTRRARPVLKLKKTEHHATRMKVADLKQRLGFQKLNVDAGGEGSGLADELTAMKYDVSRVMFGANPSHDDYFNVRAEMYWQLSAAMKAGMAIEPDDELEEELSVIGGTASYKERSVNGTKRVVFWLPPKEDSGLGRSPDKADGLALSTYQPKMPAPSSIHRLSGI